MKRFIILGLPRSGSTYLMSLLNAHSKILCSGEEFNPYAVVGVAAKDDSHQSVICRDTDPLGFFTGFFDEAQRQSFDCAGFKFMIGHNIEVLQEIADDPDVMILYVWRENRLAQASSWIKALTTRNWAQTSPDAQIGEKVHATPRQISQHWHEFASYDYLISHWLNSLKNKHITLEYKELFHPDFSVRICGFLGVAPDVGMKSALVKQNTNMISDRFEDPKPIRYYFTTIGKARWLGAEL